MALEDRYFAAQRRQSRCPLWLGDAPVSGKTLLLHAEQGLGDTIQFIRYARLLAGRGAKVVCEVQPELRSLLSRLDNIDVVAQGEPLPRSTCTVPCSAFRSPSQRSPGRSRRPSPISRLPLNGWRTGAIISRKRPRAGFVWSGSPSHKNDSNRSIPLARLATLFRIRHSTVSVFKANCATRTAKCSWSVEPCPSRRRVARFRRYGRRHLLARRRRFRRHVRRASGRRDGQTRRDPSSLRGRFSLDARSRQLPVVPDGNCCSSRPSATGTA